MSTQEATLQQPLLQAIDLKKHYPVKKGMFAPERLVKALDGVSFNLERGKTLAVVGESGCGKSTLGRLLTMIEMPTGGELYYQGQDLLKHDPQAQKLRRQKIQIVFQNPYGSLNPRKKVGQILEEPLLINTSLSKEQRREKALSMMAKVGLKTEHYDRYPHMFSGGQRQRIAIARGLMLDPDVVIADEPVSALDVSVRAQVLNLMMDLQQELGLSYVFISHDLSVVEHIADEVMVMYLGRCVEKGTKDQIFNNPRHPYTQALLSATPRLNPDDRRERIKLSGELPSPLNPPPGCAFNARCRRRFGPCTQLQPQLKVWYNKRVSNSHRKDVSMQLFELVSPRLFRPLAGPNRAFYAELLLLLWEECRHTADYSISRAEAVSRAEDYFAALAKPLALDADGAGDEDEQPTRDPHTLAVGFLLRLRRTGWLEEQPGSYESEPTFAFMPEVTPLLDALEEILNPRVVTYTGKLYKAWQLLGSIGQEKSPYENVLREVAADLETLNKSLRALNASIGHYIDRLTHNRTPQEVLELFDQYEEKVVAAAYHRFKTSDNLFNYRAYLEEELDDCEQNQLPRLALDYARVERCAPGEAAPRLGTPPMILILIE